MSCGATSLDGVAQQPNDVRSRAALSLCPLWQVAFSTRRDGVTQPCLARGPAATPQKQCGNENQKESKVSFLLADGHHN